MLEFLCYYFQAVEELFKLMALFGARNSDATETELREVTQFRRNTLAAYLAGLEARGSWGTLNTALRTLADTDEEKFYVLQSGGLSLVLDVSSMNNKTSKIINDTFDIYISKYI